MRVIILVFILISVSVNAQDAPPMPTYSVRGDAPAGDRLAPGRDGEKLYRNLCGACHLPWGMGSNLITARAIRADMPPPEAAHRGLLENRTDLQPEYIKTVVRNGLLAMPRLSRVEVTDAELESIATYLTRNNP